MTSTDLEKPTPTLAFSYWSEMMQSTKRYKQIFLDLKSSMVKPVYSSKLHKIERATKLLKEAIPEFPEGILNTIETSEAGELKQTSPPKDTNERGSWESITSFGCKSEPSDSSEEEEEATVSRL
jgi:hypothetical protein